jgi:hypothetical protein
MRLVHLLLFLILAALPCFASPAAPEGVDSEAIAAYRAGDLETARCLWLDLLTTDPPVLAGAERARVLYNLGNLASRRLDDLEAVGWYTASLRLRPRDGDTRDNLELARLGADLPPADRGDLTATLRMLLTSLTVSEAGWLALFSLAPLLFAFLFEAVRGGRRWRWATLAAVLLGILGSLPFFFSMARDAADPLLVISSDGASVRAEPRADSDLVEKVEAGVELLRIDQFPGWFRVDVGRGRSGWVVEGEMFPLVQ